jgi:hypothetical protein
MRVAAHDRSVDVPAGWDARIYRRHGAAPVLHLATFPLKEQDGDFGAGPTGRMRGDDIFIALVEYLTGDKLRPGHGLFAPADFPLPLRAGEFNPRQLQVTRRGQLGVQRFFSEDRRPCCLYVVLQPGRRGPEELVKESNRVLATLRFSR